MPYQTSSHNLRSAFTISTMLFVLALTVFAPASFAQTYHVLYNFRGQSDGANPTAGVTLDQAGNLYGTASAGGSTGCNNNGIVGCGTVYKLSPKGGGWIFAPLHQFSPGFDGANPEARVVFGPNGLLYGTTSNGGEQNYGTVFQLQPPAHICPTPSCPWSETQLYSFQGPYASAYPGAGDLVFDPQGNIFGTTVEGNGYLCDDGPCGSVYKLTPSSGGWSEREFDIGFSGLNHAPVAGLVADGSGNFFGTTTILPGGLYRFSGAIGITLYIFSQQGGAIGGLIFGSSGELCGSTSYGGSGGGGTVFQYSVSGLGLTTLYSFAGSNQFGAGSTATLLQDAAGNLYGVRQIDGAHQQGSVFKLSQSNGVWTMTTLHDFTGGADGGQPFGQLIMDASGNIYGTAEVGGSSVGNCYEGLGCGVIFEITPN